VQKKEIKTGILRGDGPPGYVWNVLILDLAFREAMSFLNEDQYQHLAMQFKELALENDPSHSCTTDVRQIDDFLELRDKGWILGKINVRVYFGLEHNKKNLVVLGCIKKESEGKTPKGDILRMRRRWRKYKSGDFTANS
jgi:phage-related protein